MSVAADAARTSFTTNLSFLAAVPLGLLSLARSVRRRPPSNAWSRAYARRWRSAAGPLFSPHCLGVRRKKENNASRAAAGDRPARRSAQLISPDASVSGMVAHAQLQRWDRETHLRAFIAWCDERGVTRPQELTRPVLQRYQRYLFRFQKKDGGALLRHRQDVRRVFGKIWFGWMVRPPNPYPTAQAG